MDTDDGSESNTTTSEWDTQAGALPGIRLTAWVRAIAVVQVVGGVVGVALAAWLLSSPVVPQSSIWTTLVPSLAAIHAGILLWRDKPMGLEMSILFQFLQIIEVARPFTYEFRLGLALQAMLIDSSFKLVPKLGTAIFYGPSKSGSPYDAALNVSALVAFCYLGYIWMKYGGRHDIPHSR